VVDTSLIADALADYDEWCIEQDEAEMRAALRDRAAYYLMAYSEAMEESA
jgi:hypothetical protein